MDAGTQTDVGVVELVEGAAALLSAPASHGYAGSPACALVATHCCVCNRPLVDALSVTSGIGPICAKKYGGQHPQAPACFPAACVEAAQLPDPPAALVAALHAGDAQAACNVATHWIAALRTGPEVARLIALVFALGYHTLASTLVENLGLPVITLVVLADEKKVALVKTPYLGKAAFGPYLAALQSIPGRKWNQALKRNEFPYAAAHALRTALRAHFAPGAVVVGSRITAL